MQEQDLPEIQNKRDTSIQLSIIVPVYNAEQYLDECVNSILSQSYQNIELILVDDGSQDSSPQMCDEYSENDCRVIVIHQPNAGTSAARNSGIAHATGEYITFVDNDDFLMTGDCIKKLMERVDSERPDVLMHMNRVFNSATGEFLPSRDTKLVGEIQKDNKASVLQGIIRSGLITRAVWTKVVSRELVENNDILFPLGLRNEDTDWTGKVIECAQSVVWYEESFYAYRKGTDYAQTSKPLTQQVVDDLAQVILGRLESIHNKGLSDKEKHVCNAYLAYPYVVWMGQASVLHLNADNDRYFSQMKDAAPLLIGAHDDPAVSKIYYLYKIAGFNITMKALGFVFRRRYPSVVAGNHQQESS